MFGGFGQSQRESTSDQYPDGFDPQLAAQMIRDARLKCGSLLTDSESDVLLTAGGVCDCGRVSSWLQSQYRTLGIDQLEFAARELRSIPEHWVCFVSANKTEDAGTGQSGHDLSKLSYAQGGPAYTGEPQAILDGTAVQFTEFVERARGVRNANFSKNRRVSEQVLEDNDLVVCVIDGVFTSEKHQLFIELVTPNLGIR